MVRKSERGAGPLFGLQCKWRTDVLRYGDLRAALATTDPGTKAWHELTLECAKTALDLFTRAAQLELRVRELDT